MIAPDLIYSVLCDEVRREDNGKWILLGLFDDWSVPAFPFEIPRCSIVNKWCNGQGFFVQQTRLIDSDDRVLIQSEPVEFDLPSLEVNFTAVQVFSGWQIERTEKIWVEILLDGELKQRFGVRVGLT